MGYEYSILVLNLTEGPGKDIKSENIPPGMVLVVAKLCPFYM